MRKYLKILIVFIFIAIKFSYAADGSKENPFNVLLVPADGGTEEGTILDF